MWRDLGVLSLGVFVVELGGRISYYKFHPLVLHKVGQILSSLQHCLDSTDRSIHNVKAPHWLVHLSHLCGESYHQVSKRPLQYSHITHYIHGHFGTCSMMLNVDGGEEVLQIDSRADQKSWCKNTLQVGSSLIVSQRIIRRQECSPVQKHVPCQLSPSDNHRCVCRMVQLFFQV